MVSLSGRRRPLQSGLFASPFPKRAVLRRGGALLALCAALLANALSAQAQDGRAILQKVVDSYQKLSSYEGAATIDARTLYQGKPLRMSSTFVTLKIKRPNRILLNVSLPS